MEIKKPGGTVEKVANDYVLEEVSNDYVLLYGEERISEDINETEEE